MLSASDDCTLKVWDIETGAERLTLTGHTTWVNGCAFSPDGRRAISSCSDGTLKVWDLETGTERATLWGHTGSVWDCAVSPDGRWVLSASEDAAVTVWDLETGTERAALLLTGGGYVVIHPTQPLIASGGDLMVAELVGCEYGPLVVTPINSAAGPVLRCPSCRSEQSVDDGWLGQTIDCPAGCPARLAVVGPSAVAARPAPPVSSPEAEPDAPIRLLVKHIVLAAHADGVNAVVFSPDGTRLVSASEDRTLMIWDAVRGERLATLTGHESGVTSAAWSPDGGRVVSASWDDTLMVWDAVGGDHVAILKGHRWGVGGVDFSPDGAHIGSASGDRTVRIWDALSHKRIATLRGHKYRVNAVAFSPDGSRLVSASGTYSENFIREQDNALMVWDVATHKRVATLPGHLNVVRAVAFSPGSSRIISGADDWTVRVWDAGSGAQLADLLGHRGPVRSVAYAPDGSRILSGSADGSIKVWEADTFTESHTFHHPPDGVEIATISGHTAGVNAVAYSPDGERIASGSLDQTVRIWDAAAPGSPAS